MQAGAIPYLKMIRKELGSEGTIHLFTLEKDSMRLNSAEENEAKLMLKEHGIVLVYRRYHFFGLKAMLAWLGNLFWLSRYCKKEQIDLIHAFGGPAASSAHVLKKFNQLPYIIDSYEPHAESMLENGSWTKRSLAYNILRYFERITSKHAKAVLATTAGMKEYAAKTYKTVPFNFTVRPACASLTKFNPDKSYSLSRSELSIKEDAIVCVYAGKIGGIYLREEIFDLVKVAHEKWGEDFIFLLLADVPESELNELLHSSGFPETQLRFLYADHKDIPALLNLADFALNPVRPVPSKRYCTSIKDSEYWAMGLPIIIPQGISDDSQLVKDQDIGAVLNGFNTKAYEQAIDKVERLMSDKLVLKQKIRGIAKKHRSEDRAQQVYAHLYGEGGALRLKEKTFFTLIYNSYADPLYQNLVHEYLQHQTKENINYRVQLVTFEQEKYRIEKEEKEAIKMDLREKGILWHPLTYHSGEFMFIKKFYDLLSAFWQLGKIQMVHKPKLILAFANTSAAISLLFSRIFRTKLMVYSFEPHSEFMVEFGIWKETGWRNRLLRFLENKTANYADYILTGTSHMKKRLDSIAKGEVHRAPSSVDESKFSFDKDARLQKRSSLGWGEHKIMIYTGKFGGIYYDEEITALCDLLHRKDPSWRFIFLTPSDHQYIWDQIDKCSVPRESFMISESHGSEEMSEWLSAADIGLSAIPPLQSQKFRSPVKIGEYLLCGLPYITCKGISEDDEIAISAQVGVVVESLKTQDLVHLNENIDHLLSVDEEEMRRRCRAAGINYRGRAQVDQLFSEIFAKVE